MACACSTAWRPISTKADASRLALIHSPFVGPGCWAATAAAAPGGGAVDYGGLRAPDWYDGVGARIAAQCDGAPWVAVLHSGAGGFAPAIAEAAADLLGFVFVDALLPYPGRAWTDTAPPELAAHLRRLARGDGRLPPWNAWFASDPTPGLIPDAAARAAFVRELPRVPLAFLDAVSPARTGWARLPAAYLRLSRAYEDAASEAEQRGWTVRRLETHHLAMVSEPDKVAATISALAARLGFE